jgi:hypothetical protein
VVLEVTPEKFITYDGAKTLAGAAGKLPEHRRGAAKSSDTVRLQRELRARGLS